MSELQPQGTEARVCEDIAERQALGIAKYGTTVANNPLSLREWLEHAYQECLDQAVYLKRAMEELDKIVTKPVEPAPSTPEPLTASDLVGESVVCVNENSCWCGRVMRCTGYSYAAKAVCVRLPDGELSAMEENEVRLATSEEIAACKSSETPEPFRAGDWYWQCEAVKHKAASWEVNAKGMVQFRWIHEVQ